MDQEEPANQRVADNVAIEGNQQADDQQGCNYSLFHPRGIIRCHLYFVNQNAFVSVYINEPINIDETFSAEYSTEWRRAADSLFLAFIVPIDTAVV